MKKRRVLVDGAFYHVTSRTNNQSEIFKDRLGQRIILLTLGDAKEKFGFRLANFCIMPTHIHLLILPAEGTNLSRIMHWIKMLFAKRWNHVFRSKDHLWGGRFFSRAITDQEDYETIMHYIDQNPVKAGLAEAPADWAASGAYHKKKKIKGLLDL